MSNREANPVYSYNNEGRFLAFTFAVDGSSVATMTTTGITGYVTVAKKGASTGVYTFTFLDTYNELLFADVRPFKAAGTLDMKVDECTESNFATATAPTVEFQVKKSSDGTALDPTSISFKCFFFFRNSTVTP